MGWSLEAKLAAWELQSEQPGGGMMLRKEIERSARAHGFGRILRRIQDDRPRPAAARAKEANAPKLWRVREAMTRYAAFEDIGKRMLLAWNEGITGLRGKRVYSLQEWNPSSAFEAFSDPLPHSNENAVVGRSEGLAGRS